jgi:hypothetical protein
MPVATDSITLINRLKRRSPLVRNLLKIPKDCFNLLPFRPETKCPVYSAKDMTFK